MIVRPTSSMVGRIKILLIAWLAFSLNACALNQSNQSEAVHLQASDKESPSMGSQSAPVTIVEFTDFECPFCGAVQPALKQIQESYPKQVRFVFKNFPLSFHRNARKAHLAAMCADEQGKFWEYRNELFRNQGVFGTKDLIRYAQELKLEVKSFERCLDQEKYASKIDGDLNQGTAFGIRGTPAFLVNGKPLFGAHPFSSFQELIEQELAGNHKSQRD